ncbi:unnamed protein product, partial [Mesorhabditis spiculigera]
MTFRFVNLDSSDTQVAATEWLTAHPLPPMKKPSPLGRPPRKPHVGTISTIRNIITNKSNESNKSTSSKKKEKMSASGLLTAGRDKLEIVDAGVEGGKDVEGKAGRPDAGCVAEQPARAEVPLPPPAASNEDALSAEPAAAKSRFP